MAFFEDQHHFFWIGTSEGVFMRSSFLKRFEYSIPLPDLNAYKEIRDFIQNDSLLWIADQGVLTVFNLNQASSTA